MPRFGRLDTSPRTIGNATNVSPDLRRPMPVHEDYGQGFSPGVNPAPPEAISHFLSDFGNKAIRSGAAGNTTFHHASDQFTDMFTGWTATVNYTRNHGQENMRVTYELNQKHIIVPDVRKKKSEEEIQRTQLEDIMLDGYACILLEWGDSVPTGSHYNFNFAAYFNGEFIGIMYPPKLGVNSLYLITLTFGKSLFRAHSYIDKINPDTKLKNMIIPPRPDKLLPAYSPIAIKNRTTTSQAPFWDNAIWGTDNLLYPSGGDNAMFGAEGGFFHTKILTRINYPYIKKSPLRLKGMNTFSVVAADSGEIDYFKVYAEFFDRKELRQVQQSWNYSYGDNQDIIVNDKPRYWVRGFHANSGTNELFDLSSTYNTDRYELTIPKGYSPPNPKDCIP